MLGFNSKKEDEPKYRKVKSTYINLKNGNEIIYTEPCSIKEKKDRIEVTQPGSKERLIIFKSTLIGWKTGKDRLWPESDFNKT